MSKDKIAGEIGIFAGGVGGTGELLWKVWCVGQFLGLGITSDGYLFLLLVTLQELRFESSEYILIRLSLSPGVRS